MINSSKANIIINKKSKLMHKQNLYKMKKLIVQCLLFLTPALVFAQNDKVLVVKSGSGFKLTVNGKETFINGMNWDYFPIGTNYNYSLWKQSDQVITAALDIEMPLLKNMGVNVIRQYTGVPTKWVKYIYENYGIYTMLNHSFGRYGLTVKGRWEANTDYSDPNVREILLKETKEMVTQYKETPGILLFLLGNENNYGLFWRGAETENIPLADRKSTKDANYMYKLFNDAAKALKEIDNNHPISICNGDLLFADIIAKECKDVDILGINCYRGASFTDLYDSTRIKLNMPILLTEFGADAYNTVANKEDQEYQAKVLLSNWKEIYENASGMGKNDNSLGGFTFQFSDGWWKTGQTINLDEHDATASWSNGGYSNDYIVGENNMNEEWFGICAKGQTNERGTYELYPRAAYYALQNIHRFNPYNTTTESINMLFKSVQLQMLL
jgi:Glycosyl hydrolases family 2, TIM barrel domain